MNFLAIKLKVIVCHHGQNVGRISPPVSKATRKDVLSELMEVSKSLKEIITKSRIRKKKMDRLNKKVETYEDLVNNEKEEEEQSASDDEVDSSKS